MPFRLQNKIACLLLLVGVGVLPSSAAAERVLFVSTPARLAEASRVALSAWNVEIVEVNEPSPGHRMPEAADRASELCERHRARAVVWMVHEKNGAALWMYDATDARVVSRRVPQTHLNDDGAAAELALSVKTLLRQSRVAPEHEHIPLPPPEPPRFSIGTRIGARFRAIAGNKAELRLGLVLDARLPWRFLWAQARLFAGPAHAIETPDLSASLTDLTPGLAIGFTPIRPIRPSARGGLNINGELGLDAHLTHLSGTRAFDGQPVSARRVNPAAFVGVLLSVEAGHRIEIGVVVEGSYLLRSQTYTVLGETVLETPRAEVFSGFILRFPAR